VPAINYIAITAQGLPGKEGKYLLRMPDTEIDKAVALADKIDGIVILDIQIGFSSLEHELPMLEKYLAMPGKKRPGTVIGTLDAREVNLAVDTLSRLVKEHELPPKMLIVHRFTRPMLTNQEQIRLDPRVQVVIDMDGFGAPFLKRDSYRRYVFEHPVQFTGFKIFYKNDKPQLTPEEVMKLVPVPVFIMYQ
jgi:hypothetical protein